MNNIAIIPARGGSKRIPNKNIKVFFEKPIIAYSIEVANESGLFSEIMVSTDDEEIADVAVKYGAKVPFLRSETNANDFATLTDVLLEVLDRYSIMKFFPENVCCILPTAPLIFSDRLIEGWKLLNSGHFTSVFPVLQFSYPIQRALKLNKDSAVEMFWPENLTKRSQDLEPAFHDSGQFYWIKSETLLKEKTLFTQHAGMIKLSNMEAQDIDTYEDWKLAEMKYRLLNA